jgi:alpha-methylacyl-CoA racemase
MKPLSGVKVLDLTSLLPAPLVSTYLSMLGAEVLKIESPAGDNARNFKELFQLLNSSKKQIRLDLKDKNDLTNFLELVKTTDIVIENFKPGSTEKLGISYSSLSKINKRLVYCSIIGYKNGHQRHQHAGHDINFLALSGILKLMKNHDLNSLQLPNFQLADIAAGTYPALSGILCGLYHSEKTKEGSHVNISILENLKPLYLFLSHLLPTTDLHYPNILSGNEACYSLYKTKDDLYMSLGAFEEKFFKVFVIEIGLPKLKYSHLKEFFKETKTKDIISKVISTKDQAYWTNHFQYIDCCFTPVLEPLTFQLVPPFYYL